MNQEKDEQLKKDKEVEEAKKKKRIRYSAPGLKIFRQEYLIHFKRKYLNIKNDFGYARKLKLMKDFNLTESDIDQILHTPWKFINHVSPETVSPLITEKKDFASICDFLFFIHVSTTSKDTASISKKALFSLIKNYDYPWKFGLRHILPALLNLGMEESIFMDPNHYHEILSNCLEPKGLKLDFNKHFEKFELSGRISMHDDSDSEAEDEKNDETEKWNPNKYELIRRTMKTISDLICSYPQRCVFLRMRYMQTKTNEPVNVKEDKNFDYAQCLVVFYIMATVGSDQHLIRDSSVRGSINSAFRTMLDRYVCKLQSNCT